MQNSKIWWDNLSSLRKTQICDTNTELVGSVRRWETLTNKEIEYLWNREVNGECTKCRQTVQNCECYIPDEVKHKGLYNMHKILPELLKKIQ